MLGRMLVAGTVAGMLLAGIAWMTGVFPLAAQDRAVHEIRPEPRPTVPAPAAASPKSIGQALYPPLQAAPSAVAEGSAERRTLLGNPIVIPNSRLALPPYSKVDVPAQREGVLKFIGVEVRPGETPPPDAFEVALGKDRTEKKLFRHLREGDYVQKDELLGRVDDTLALADLKIKVAKVEAAKADLTASEKTRDETYQRWMTQKRLYGEGGARYTSTEDLRGAELTYFRYLYEAASKVESIHVANQEQNQAIKTLDMCDIRCPISGVIKGFYRHEGEAIKAIEPQVLQIQNYDRLRAEGTVDRQYLSHLHVGDTVAIEAIRSENPEQIFPGHRLDVAGIAVGKDPRHPLLVSVSEDGTAFVWDANQRRVRQVLTHPGSAIRAVACTPPTAQANLCLTGTADGKARLWDLDRTAATPLRELHGWHRGSVRCAAFSPDGATCATGGDDGEIRVWDVRTGEPRYPLIGHRNWVTALSFTPDAQLVSASRDDTVRVWNLGKDAGQQVQLIKRRYHAISQLGVSPDGKYVMDEQGRELRVLALDTQMTEAVLENGASQTGSFTTLALFSPDGRLGLTTSGSEGVLQLFRIGSVRSPEVVDLISGQHSRVRCAAFSPDGSFVAAGLENGKVCVWPMPPREELDRQLPARITTIEQAVENVEGKVRLLAEFVNPKDRPLRSGDFVTIVAYPKR